MKRATFYSGSVFNRPFLIAFLGLLFCLWNRLDPASVPCPSSGCHLFQGGAERPTLWLLGCVGFFVLMLCDVFKKPNIGRLCAGFGLSLDACLFIIMVLTLPCLVCVITGVLLALCYRAFFIKVCLPRLEQNPRVLRRSFLLLLWSALFVINAGLIARDFVTPWPLNEGGAEKSIAIFFSPSCPACKRLVERIPFLKEQEVAWYPVMERSQDLASVAMLRLLFVNGAVPLPEALAVASEAPPLTFFEAMSPSYLLLQFRLWVNGARALSLGDGKIPLLVVKGVPDGSIFSIGKAKSDALPLELDLDSAGMCGGKTRGPCT